MCALAASACCVFPCTTGVAPQAADDGYEETISERWSNDAGQAFPSIPGLGSVRSLSAAADGTALALGANGKSAALSTAKGCLQRCYAGSEPARRRCSPWSSAPGAARARSRGQKRKIRQALYPLPLVSSC